MNFTVKENNNVQPFGKLSVGDLFLSKDKEPYIKTVDVSDDYCGDVYNCIGLGTGYGWKFREDEKVIVPSSYELKISL